MGLRDEVERIERERLEAEARQRKEEAELREKAFAEASAELRRMLALWAQRMGLEKPPVHRETGKTITEPQYDYETGPSGEAVVVNFAFEEEGLEFVGECVLLKYPVRGSRVDFQVQLRDAPPRYRGIWSTDDLASVLRAQQGVAEE